MDGALIENHNEDQDKKGYRIGLSPKSLLFDGMLVISERDFANVQRKMKQTPFMKNLKS